MRKSLVVVESPAKARTVARFLGDDYVVEASRGHVRDLPQRGLSIDVDDHFTPQYVVPPKKQPDVKRLRAALRGADELILATDEDREGEAIAWHVREVLGPKVPVRRMVFHEITREAILAALEHPRDLDMKLVEAQEGRRVLDRLVGYEVSPVLWRRVGGARSAGRVQSVATRLVVERERDRMAFRAASYWDLEGDFSAAEGSMRARLVELGGRRLAQGRDFDPSTGALATPADVALLDETGARALAARMRGASFRVASVESKEFTERPKAPFITSTLQQEAGNKLRFSAARTMSVAQDLYEGGYITYHRTDNVQLSQQALDAARAQVVERFGREYLAAGERQYRNKVKNAQEAHEAVRPAGARFRTPEELADELAGDHLRLYELVWMRTLAGQMADALGSRVTLRIAGASTAGDEAVFRAAGKTYSFLGYRKAYVDTAEDDDADETEATLPPVRRGETLECTRLDAWGHETQPPPRYTEASLVKELEERGIGRPSTYASILDTITNVRGYVWKKGSALVPSWTAFAKIQLLERYFPHLIDYGFTAAMEEALDGVARGEGEVEKWLHEFYFGDGRAGLKDLVAEEHLAQIDMSVVNAIRIGEDPEGREILVRVWSNGESLHRADEKAPLPADLAPDELTLARAEELLARGAAGPRVLGIDPATGENVLVLTGRYGPFVQLGEVDGDPKAKPPRASLLASMDADTVTLDDALKLLGLPRVVGVDGDGVEITAQNGRYGPYLKKGGESRSLDTDEQLFTITLAEAEALFALPKRRRGRVTKPPIAELGPDPSSGAAIRVLDGRYGPYVTDGTTNATIPRGIDPRGVTLEHAVELLREHAARGRARRTGAAKGVRRTAKTSAKKAAGKAAGKRVARGAAATPGRATGEAAG